MGKQSCRDYRLLGFFSGFPSRSFPYDIAERLRKELVNRNSLVFVSAWPADYAKNDYESTGMHGMFEKIGLPFTQHHVIDDRVKSLCAAQLIREASCIFLMGGHPGLQLKLMQETGLDNEICESSAAILGVSAGAINMAKRSLDTKESPIPYAGLGLANITVKPHFEPTNQQMRQSLLQISMELPICAMEDDSAIFAAGGKASVIGAIHYVNKGKICPLQQESLLL